MTKTGLEQNDCTFVKAVVMINTLKARGKTGLEQNERQVAFVSRRTIFLSPRSLSKYFRRIYSDVHIVALDKIIKVRVKNCFKIKMRVLFSLFLAIIFYFVNDVCLSISGGYMRILRWLP